MYYYLIALLVFAIDQASKWMIVKYMEIGQGISVIGNFFTLTSIRNKGAAFSMLEGKRWLLITISIVAFVVISYMLNKFKSSSSKMMPIALSLILGGAVGNFLDRAVFGEVVDFLQFHFEAINYTFAIFNLADVAISCGAILIILDSLITWRKEKKEAAQSN
ncbi:signal peptidase II [Paenibacillus albiflavus]|uniref:Lipoprotein signal peptidase n=1 Tax=Paenibacillus albiflavus TaxID=2545760 RepID=A0A4R4EKC4_9BACL|nr:signal peptidase II [Paenibacillus albiflavus]TCZ78728.1 signal peptidase II [Paenibacillus albiflavus]